MNSIIFPYRAFIDIYSYILFYKIRIKSVKESKIAPGVAPGTIHTNPLMTIGSHPTDTMGPRLQVLGLVEGVPGVKVGVERQQVNISYKYHNAY